jgi:hypothetical protein
MFTVLCFTGLFAGALYLLLKDHKRSFPPH